MNYFNYFSEIEELFIRRRGRNLLLSPLDWALIETWQERGVPLHIILSGIEKIFDSIDKQPSSGKRTVKSLLYCKEEIEAQYAQWLERQVGKSNAEVAAPTQIETEKIETQTAENNVDSKSDLFSDEAIQGHLESVSREIEAAHRKANGDFQTTLEKVSKQLAELRGKGGTAKQLEEKLEKLDRQIDESLVKNFETDALKESVKKQTAAYKSKMEPEVYRRTFDLVLVKKLREQKEIPRLSLFYL